MLKLYSQSLLRHWPAYLFGTFFLLLTSVSEIVVPKFIQWTLDAVHVSAKLGGGSGAAQLGHYAWSLGAFLICGFIGRVGWRHLLARRTHEAGYELKVDFWNALRRQPLSVFDRYTLGDLMNRATGDWHAARVIHGFTLVLTLDLIFFTVFALVMMFAIDPFVALLCILIFPFLPPKILKIARKEHDLHLVAQEELSSLSQAVTQTLSSLRFNRATDSEEVKAKILTQHARDYADRRLAVVQTGWKIYPWSALPTLIAYGILLGVGVLQVSRGLLTIGEFVALQSYVLMLQGPLLELGDCIAEWQKGFASLGRIHEIIGLKDRVDRQHWHDVSAAESTQPLPILRLREVFFRYGSEGDWILNNIHLAVNPGEWAGLSGPIGAGKTTLIHLCAGLLPSKQGTVDIGGRDISGVSNQWLRSQITVMTQRSFLFASTIRSNLCLDLAFTDEQLWEVLEKVGLAADFSRLPDKLDEVLGESGVNLSGGQRQRLAFARGLLRLNPVLLIDDALSAVDAQTEAKILEAIKPILRDKTVLWAAHRGSTLGLCHQVYHLERGVLSL